MNAYKCDGCAEYHDGEPLYAIEPTYRTAWMPPLWEACSTRCLVSVAEKVRARIESSGERTDG